MYMCASECIPHLIPYILSIFVVNIYEYGGYFNKYL